MTITELTPLGDIAAAIPSSVRIFQHHGLDFCCGGKRALGAVCDERGLSFTETVAAIEASTSTATDDRDWTNQPPGVLIEHIMTTYHDTLRKELPRLQALAARVSQSHGTRAPHLLQIVQNVDALAADLLDHMRKEEIVLFPAIRAIDEGRADGSWLAAPISVMEREHDDAGALLSDLRKLTRDYTPPEGACATTRALYQGLEELERSMHVHVHLENNVLFPRALGREAAAAAI